MRLSLHPAWLSLGAIGSLGCVWFAAELVRSYIRHIPTGDQAGVGLGLMFLVMWQLPAATVPVVLSAASRAPASPSPARRAPGWASWALLASGGLMIAFTALYAVNELPGAARELRAMETIRALLALSHAGLMLGIAVVWLGFGSAARAASAAPPAWLPPMLLATAAATLVLDAGILIEGFRGAYPGVDPWALLVRNLLYFCTPGLILVVALCRSAWVLSRTKLPAAA